MREARLDCRADPGLLAAIPMNELDVLMVESKQRTPIPRPLGWPAMILGRLRVLNIETELECCVEVLSVMHVPRLEEFSAEVPRYSSKDGVQRLTQAVARSQATLREITIASDANEARAVIDADDFGPLFHCHRLTSLSVINLEMNNRGRPWQDADMNLAANCWTALQFLELRHTSYDHAHPNICHLIGLMPIADHCKSLRKLVVAVNMWSFEPPSRVCLPAPSLRELEVMQDSILSFQCHAPDFIARLWPNVRVLPDQDPWRPEHGMLMSEFCDQFNNIQDRVAQRQYAWPKWEEVVRASRAASRTERILRVGY